MKITDEEIYKGMVSLGWVIPTTEKEVEIAEQGLADEWLRFDPGPMTETESTAMRGEIEFLRAMSPLSTFEQHIFTEGWRKARQFYLYQQNQNDRQTNQS
jgi:hypothetical protein